MLVLGTVMKVESSKRCTTLAERRRDFQKDESRRERTDAETPDGGIRRFHRRSLSIVTRYTCRNIIYGRNVKRK